MEDRQLAFLGRQAAVPVGSSVSLGSLPAESGKLPDFRGQPFRPYLPNQMIVATT